MSCLGMGSFFPYEMTSNLGRNWLGVEHWPVNNCATKPTFDVCCQQQKPPLIYPLTKRRLENGSFARFFSIATFDKGTCEKVL